MASVLQTIIRTSRSTRLCNDGAPMQQPDVLSAGTATWNVSDLSLIPVSGYGQITHFIDLNEGVPSADVAGVDWETMTDHIAHGNYAQLPMIFGVRDGVAPPDGRMQLVVVAGTIMSFK